MKKPSSDKFKGKAVLLILGILLFSIMILLILLEPMLKNKLVIRNKSSHRITKLMMWYEDSNGERTNVQDLIGLMPSENKKINSEMELHSLTGTTWLTIQIAFEDGGEAVFQTGEFSTEFEGKITLEICDSKSEDLMLKLKAGEGLFNSSNGDGCDVMYYVNPKDGYIE